MLLDLGVTTLPSLVTNRKLAPPVSSTLVRCAALEVGTHGRREYAELIFVGRLYADNGAAAEDERTQIERCAGSVGRHIVGVGFDNLFDRVQKSLLRKCRDLQTLGALLKTLRVEVGTEHNNLAVHGGVCLQALKNGLRILQNACALAHGDSGIGRHHAVVPLAVLVVGHIALAGGNVSPVGM